MAKQAANPDVRALLIRRPPAAGATAFGHVDLSPRARTELSQAVRNIITHEVTGRKKIPFHPEDRADDGEVLATPLSNFDSFFQTKAAWSLQRTVAAIRAQGLPQTLGATGISDGKWSFYALRLRTSQRDIVVVRAKSPTFGLTGQNKLLAQFIGNELRPVTSPLLSFDYAADVVVIGGQAYVVEPRAAERLFVDAEAVKARAPLTAKRFTRDLGATVTKATANAIERVCSRNAFVARRAERLVTDKALRNVKADAVRAAVPLTGLPAGSFGVRGPLRAESDDRAKMLIEIAADLYYQPRFASTPRRVGSYRNVR